MGLALEHDEATPTGVRRIVDEQLDAALGELRDAGGAERPADRDKAVHAARKRLKRARAVVRLLHGALDPADFAHANQILRDTGRALADARDAAVIVETLEGLRKDLPGDLYAPAHKRLMARRRAVAKRVLETPGGLESGLTALADLRERAAGWAIDGDGWDVLRPGLKRVYRDGRDTMSVLVVGELDGHGAEMFHEWRKRAKDLWHHCEVLENVWPELFKPLAGAFHDLADLLGDEHDLAVLRVTLRADADVRGEPADRLGPMIEVIDRKRVDLQGRAKALGEKLFAEKPGALLRRFEKYWHAWKPAPAFDGTPDDAPAKDAPDDAPPAALTG